MSASDTQTDRQNDADENNTSPKTKFLGEGITNQERQAPISIFDSRSVASDSGTDP